MVGRSLVLASLIAACAPSPVASSHDENLTCDLGSPGALASACEKAAFPMPTLAQPLSSSSGTRVEADYRAYGVHLVAGASGNEGLLTFTPAASGTFEIYLGTPNIPFHVVSDAGEVSAGCTSSITSTECTYLRKVRSFDLVAGTAYRIELGPTTVSYVRLFIQTEITPGPTCVAGELTEETAACTAASQGAQKIAAVPLTSMSPPELALDSVYIVTLPSNGATTYAGAFGFTPPSDGDYELYLGTPNIPLRVFADVGPAVIACTQYIPSTECNLLRRGTAYSLRGGISYRFELGPNPNTHYVRVTLRKSSHATIKLGPPQIFPVTTPSFITAADLNNDQALDIAVSSANDAGGIAEIVPLRGSGTGSFTAGTAVQTSLPMETVVADFNHDGIPDIAGIAWDGQGPLPEFYLQGQGNLTYTRTTWGNGVDYEPHITAADFNEDGTPDLLAAWADLQTTGGAGGFIITLMPSFTVAQDEPAYGHDTVQAVAGDFNGDGHQDVVAASRTASALKLYLGDGSGRVTFASDVALPGGAIRVIAAFDLDKDGKSDIVAIHLDNTVTVSFGTATGFTAPQTLVISNTSVFAGIAAGDFDHDGRLDLAIGAADPSFDIAVFLATPGGFVRGGTLAVQNGANDLAVGDFNGDGFDDLAATTVGGVAVFLSHP